MGVRGHRRMPLNTSRPMPRLLLQARIKLRLMCPPPTLRGGSSAQLAFKVTDSHGKTVTDFEVEHTKLFHLIIVSRDLSYFTHIHPGLIRMG